MVAEQGLGTLLEGARKREPEALAELCARFYPAVLKFMHYRVGAGQAEDLTGEVFLRVVRAIEGQNGSFRAWLYRIAANVVAQWFRQKRIRERVRIDGAAVEASTSRAVNPAEAAARRIDLAEAIAKLTDDQRELVTYKFIQGFSNDLISRITGRTPGAIRALQFRALAALRRILSSEPEHSESTA